MHTTSPQTQSVLEALKASRQHAYGTARPMPAEYYRSKDFLEAEHVFRKQWICLARQEKNRLEHSIFKSIQ